MKHFRELSYVWMAEGLIYHMTPKNLKMIYSLVSTGHFCYGYENLVAQELAVHFGWYEREVPQRRNWWWSGEFMINYDGYGFVPCMTWPTSFPRPTQPHSTPPYRTTCTVTSPITPSNTDTITNTTPGNANQISTINLWLKCNACSLIHYINHVIYSITA